METGYEEANSNNLPTIDFIMVNDFFVKSCDYRNAEVQNVKMKRATRENYGDNAVGQVQLKRENDICTVRARITPEHRVTQRGYAVSVIVNEKEEQVVSCECHDCTASSGGCKHAVAFLMWMHRRSEEPSVTDVACYWRTSKLSRVGKTLKGSKISEMFPIKVLPTIQAAKGKFREKFIEEGKICGSDSLIVKLVEEDPSERISLHCLSIKYKKIIEETLGRVDVDDFISFCKQQIKEEDCLAVQTLTVEQSKNSKWYDARFARITASKIHEAAKSHTYEGSLVETIFGSSKISTDSMKRGLRLEDSVLQKIQADLKIKINKSGFIINPNHPFLGASPDGLSEKYCVEVKCPSKEKTVKNYIDSNNKICTKPYSQLQLQMFLSGKKHGLLCVASPTFEVDNEVKIVSTELNEDFCNTIIIEATDLWKKAIFPKLVQ